jgi:hypothetical protein
MSLLRIGATILAVVGLLYVKWALSSVGRWAFPSVVGVRILPFDCGRHFLTQGWDLSNAAVMFFLAAMMEPASRWRLTTVIRAELDGAYAVLCFIAFVCCLGIAVFVRFGIQESLRDRRYHAMHRYFWGLAGWVIGAFSLLSTAYLALRML